MISKIIGFSVQRPITVIFFTILVSIVGWVSFQNLPIDAVPDATNKQVQINTHISGLTTEEAERKVTFPIENAMRGIAGLNLIRSLTRFNISQVTVIFDEDVEIYRARQLVFERLQYVTSQLPKGIQPKLGPISTGLGEIFHYSIEAETVANSPQARIEQLMELRTLQDWHVRPKLLTVKGVTEVNTIGGFEKQFHIQPRSKDMAANGLELEDLQKALEQTNQNVGGGYVQQTGEQFLVQGQGLLHNIEEIKSVPIRYLENFKVVRISDVANVMLATELRPGAALVRGKEAVVGTAMMLLGENSRTVSLGVAEKLKEIQAGMPKGYRLNPLYNRSELVNFTLETVRHNLLLGVFLVVIILTLLMGNLRVAFITAVTIPLTLLVSFIGMKYFDISGNLMSLGALDFGIIVDGTVILLDHCVRTLHNRTKELGRSLTKEETKDAIHQASVEIRTAAGFGQLIIVVVFLPVFSLVGVEGKMFKPMAATFIIAILVALIFSFILSPALASLFLRGKIEYKESWIMQKIEQLYTPILDVVLKYRIVTIGIGLILIIVGFLLFSKLGGEFLPQLDEGSLLIESTRPVNISIDQSIKLQGKTEDLISEFPEVAYTFSKIGTSQISTDPMPINQADTYIIFKDEKDWPEVDGRKRTRPEIGKLIMKKLDAELPGQVVLLSQPIQMRFNDLLEGSKTDVSVKLFGDDMDQLAEITRQMAKVISLVPGGQEIQTELRGTSPLLKIIPKEDLLQKLGLPREAVLEAVEVALGGRVVGHIYDDVRRFPIIIRLSEKDRSNLDSIKEISIGIGLLTIIPLNEAADVEFQQVYGRISREQGKRRAAVLVNPRGRDTEGFVEEAQAKVAKEVKFPRGYYTEWGGTFKNLQTAKGRLKILAPLALFMILLMTFAVFKNIFQTALIFVCVPLALVGGVLGLMLNNLPFSISAGVGFIALSGIAVLNGIVLVNYFSQLQRQGLESNVLVRKGTLLRLRPVLMTALVEIFGFLPMMLSRGIGSEIQRPLASVVIGGIVSSTTLTLLVLPALYLFFLRKMPLQMEATD